MHSALHGYEEKGGAAHTLPLAAWSLMRSHSALASYLRPDRHAANQPTPVALRVGAVRHSRTIATRTIHHPSRDVPGTGTALLILNVAPFLAYLLAICALQVCIRASR